MLVLDRRLGVLSDSDGRRFDPQRRVWIESAPGAGERVSRTEAVGWLQRESGQPLRAPVAVIGPRTASAEQYACAETLGVGLAGMGLAVACGGRAGIMEAVCRGVSGQGGIAIGILPDADPGLANAYVTVALATGIGEARNALVARAGFCLIAVGNSYGTLSEVALGLQFGKPVFGLLGAAEVEGVVHCAGPEDALQAVAGRVLALS
jgi:uncharacterized protein (TIGR00725 family)